MKLEHKSGHEVYIDLTGNKLQIINRKTGEIIPSRLRFLWIFSHWSPDYFKNKAFRHGEHVLVLIDGLLRESDYPGTGYKRAVGIIQLHRDYNSERLNNACKIALNKADVLILDDLGTNMIVKH